MSDEPDLSAEMTADVIREAGDSFQRLLKRREELVALTLAAAEGQLVERPLSREEREVVRDALAFASCCVIVDQVRDIITKGQTNG